MNRRAKVCRKSIRERVVFKALAITVAGLCLFGAGEGRAQIPVEDQIRALVDNVPTPLDTPAVVIEELRAEGRRFFRFLRLKRPDLKQRVQRLSDADQAKARAQQSMAQIRSVCRDGHMRQLIVLGATIIDQMQFFDGSEFVTVRVDGRACGVRTGAAGNAGGFGGPAREAPDIRTRVRDMSNKIKLPIDIGIGKITEIVADKVVLKRKIVMHPVIAARGVGKDSQRRWTEMTCKHAFLGQMILDGAVFEDRMVSPEGGVLAVVSVDRAACHRVTQ